jgi:hypothetical protein
MQINKLENNINKLQFNLQNQKEYYEILIKSKTLKDDKIVDTKSKKIDNLNLTIDNLNLTINNLEIELNQ